MGQLERPDRAHEVLAVLARRVLAVVRPDRLAPQQLRSQAR
jgi:hypothetical protein